MAGNGETNGVARGEDGPKIGVLALQETSGSTRRSCVGLGSSLSGRGGPRRAGRDHRPWRRVDDDREDDGLLGLLDGIRSYFYNGGPVWGTCAGMVLAASATTGPRQPLLGLMNALVERNGFGRQVHSFEKDLEVDGFDEPFTGVFIRAPFFEDVGPGVEVLSRIGDRVVAARGENILVTAFHPELTDDVRFHEYFLREVCSI